MHSNIGFNVPSRAFRFVRVSGNKKTGPIPVTSTAAQSCPAVCPMRTDNAGGCYAAAGRSAIHWRTLTDGTASGAIDAETLFGMVRSINKGQLWRHNEAGDMPADDKGFIDAAFLSGLTDANKGRRGFTYTHHQLTPANVALIRWANNNGFTINISTNNIAHADSVKLQHKGLPVVTLIPEEKDWQGKKTIQTPAGNTIVRCPAETDDKVQCSNCGLCAVSDRRGIVGFTAHGVARKRVISIARG